ncbi:precorrin-2 dehydrogenase/sirohydrochlorin ferrochelatase family protein [Rubrobacter indicoceani]|uniref:precorrin-2 dehydrogenase/sirohydrochlorin ferrochelatase family protein n=1 Tax=Rubrobacter indicoceani TaxID=2051957 RepID=UPI000E5B3B0B|nr:bifunctional precorrin-2 dehydrogenase/sirohydrochlorin ferrochelatase [Rubrobacter indicoceani]
MNLAGRRCVMVGGGAVAGRKARRLLQARAEVVVISPEVTEELQAMATEVHRRPYESGDLDGAFLAFVATDSREVNARVVEEANERGVMVNVADEPEEGDFVLPSTLRRGGLQVAVSTGGASPVLAREIRKRLEKRFGPEWAGLVEGVRREREARLSGGSDRADTRLKDEVERCLSRLSG